MAQAKYTILIPQKDNLGNPLGDVATAAHHWMFYGPGPKVEGSFIHRGLEGNWRDDPQEKMDHLVTVANDTPEMDSTAKQLALHVAEACNQWGVFVMKEGGKQGVQSWTISNPNYRPEEPSELAQKPPWPAPAEQHYKTISDLL
jgi:hypothetical protein